MPINVGQYVSFGQYSKIIPTFNRDLSNKYTGIFLFFVGSKITTT